MGAWAPGSIHKAPSFWVSCRQGGARKGTAHLPHFVKQAVHLPDQALVFLLKLQGNTHTHGKDDIRPPLVSKLPSRRQVSSQVCLCGSLSLSAWSDAAQPGNLGTRVWTARLRETVKPAEPRGRRGRTAPPHPGGHCGPAGSPLAPACAAPFATPPTPALLTPTRALREAWLPLGSAFSSLPHLPGLLGTLAAVFPPRVEAPPSIHTLLGPALQPLL